MLKNQFHLVHVIFRGPVVPQCGDRKDCKPEAPSDRLAQEPAQGRLEMGQGPPASLQDTASCNAC